MGIIKSFLIPGLPHLLLQPDRKPQWKKLKLALDKVRAEIDEINPDLIMIYSTYWSSIIGHQIQAKEHIKWTLVDEEWHSLGSIKYEMKSDVEFAKKLSSNCNEKGLLTKLTDYEGFPVDTGTVVANSVLNPNNKFKTCVVSANIYSDRQETQVLGKAVRRTIQESNKKVVVLVISSLSNRYRLEALEDPLDSSDDKISSLKDNEWNLKMLEFLSQGRLEDVSQLSRQFHREARVTKKVVNFKPFWWWSAVTGQNNNYTGEVYEYQPVHGTGAAVVGMTASDESFGDLEFDEEDSDFYLGNRNVLSSKDEPKSKFKFTSGRDDLDTSSSHEDKD
jgi:2-aminophenol/2-amino-5-chlorophenol 1,6-dioxygenase subunit alpha